MAKKQLKGFTIIEVVLVLAIAGLIFLIVFLALPALQESQRDTQRRNDAGRLISAVQSYMANNRGQLPTQTQFDGNFVPEYMDGEFFDPSGGDYTLSSTTSDSSGVPAVEPTNPVDGALVYVVGKDCDGATTGSRTMSVYFALEGGGTYCQAI